MSYLFDLASADGFVCPAYVAEPTENPIGGLVLLQEIFGVNDHIRAVADGYAADGYLVVAPAMFERIKPQVELGYEEATMGEARALKAAVEALPEPGVQQDIAAAIEKAAEGGKVAVMGYCWGGLPPGARRTQPGLSAAVCYYGGGMTVGKEVQRSPQVPVLAHFAEQDNHISMESVKAFAKAQPGVEVLTYPAEHGFNCDQRGSFNAEAAKQARLRTLAFLAQHLG
ncbi:MAG: dienelactone hydrolase family protein [Burkholderiaceae bacterium]